MQKANAVSQEKKCQPLYIASSSHDEYRTIMHVDMDCFFASVSLRSRAHLKDKPIAVAHSHSMMFDKSAFDSTSEVKSR